MKQKNPDDGRVHYIDWLRVLAFATLILFHCAMPFVRFGWEVKNAESSIFLDRVILWLHQWRLPLLFFIAGVGVSFSLRRRNITQFIGERFVRLFIPLVFAMFFLTPLQVYFDRLQMGEISESYASFYPTVWTFIPYPEGTLTWSHMWFVAYLFTFTLVLLPVFSLSKLKIPQSFKKVLNTVFSSPVTLLVLAAPFIGYYFLFYLKWPEQRSLLGDWFVFNTSITFYLFGFLFSGIKTFWDTCLKYRSFFLSLSIVMSLFLFKNYYWDINLPKQQDAYLYWYGIFDGMFIWSIMLAVVGYAMRYLNFSNGNLRYLTIAIYPYYILHQTIIVACGYYVVKWETPIFPKLMALIAITLIGIFVLYHFIIRKTILTRVLFGVKWNYNGY